MIQTADTKGSDQRSMVRDASLRLTPLGRSDVLHLSLSEDWRQKNLWKWLRLGKIWNFGRPHTNNTINNTSLIFPRYRFTFSGVIFKQDRTCELYLLTFHLGIMESVGHFFPTESKYNPKHQWSRYMYKVWIYTYKIHYLPTLGLFKKMMSFIFNNNTFHVLDISNYHFIYVNICIYI